MPDFDQSVSTLPQASAAAVTARFILASASPRRQELLAGAGYQFDIRPADLDEKALGAGLLPIDLTLKLALAKADAVAKQYPNRVILAADTVVAFGDIPLGKAEDINQARQMLELLSGTTHLVITGVAVVRASIQHHAIARVMTAVRMKQLSRAEIERYLMTQEWQGKAGSYGIQDKDPIVERVTGCQTNVVGLPLTTAQRMLSAAGILNR